MQHIDYNKPIVDGGAFKWHEYLILREWGTLAIPTAAQIAAAKVLFGHVQTLIRGPLGKPLNITSGIRTSQYTNWLRKHGIPAAMKSAHNDGMAVDLSPPAGMTNAQFWAFCDKHWPGRMENLSATPTWVHLDTRNWGSRQRFNP